MKTFLHQFLRNLTPYFTRAEAEANELTHIFSKVLRFTKTTIGHLRAERLCFGLFWISPTTDYQLLNADFLIRVVRAYSRLNAFALGCGLGVRAAALAAYNCR